jgi:hypothetical protein
LWREEGILCGNRREMIRQQANCPLQPGRSDLVTILISNLSLLFLSLFVVRRGLDQCFVSYKICLLMISADKFSTINQQE